MKHNLVLAFLISCVVALGSVSAEAAVILLKDGSRLQGTIVSATARDIEVHTPDGILKITTDRILSINYAEGDKTQPALAEPTPILTTPPAPPSVVRRVYPENPRQSLSLGLGVAIALSRVDFGTTGGGSATNGSPGFLMDGRYLYGLNSKLSLGVDLGFSFRGGSDSQNLLPFSETDVFGHSLVSMGVVKYSLINQGYTRPYILGGLGIHRTATIVEARPNPGFVWSDTDTDETRTLVDDVHSGLAGTVRLGVDFVWHEPTVFSLELGWTRLTAATYAATQAGRDVGLESVTGNQEALTIAARWGWRF